MIAKAKVAKPTADTTVFIADGSQKTYTIAANEKYTVSGNVKTEAGKYKVSITLTDAANYEWADGTTAALNYDFVVRKSQLTDKVDETANKDTVIVETVGGFEPDTTLNVTPISPKDVDCSASLGEKEEVSAVYDVELLINGSSAQPQGAMTVRMLIPSENAGKAFRVLRVQDTIASEVQYTVDGDYIVLNIDSLGSFAIVGESDYTGLLWLIIMLAVFIVLELAVIGILNKYAGSGKNKTNKAVKTYSFIGLPLIAAIIYNPNETVLIAVLGALAIALAIVIGCLSVKVHKAKRQAKHKK